MDSQELFGFFGGTGGHLHNIGVIIKERRRQSSSSSGKSNSSIESKDMTSLLNKIRELELYENSCFMQSIPLVST
jgi:hypothetical protein